MIHLTFTRGSGDARRRASHAAYRMRLKPLQRKDFSVVPVCGSVRPLASQRGQKA
jgi:hypothetical protein